MNLQPINNNNKFSIDPYSLSALQAGLANDNDDSDNNNSEDEGEDNNNDILLDNKLDDQDENWIKQTYGQTLSKESLACPGCFTIITYQSQPHETIPNQWRTIEPINCNISTTQILISKSGVKFAPVACAECGVEIGMKDLECQDEILKDCVVLFDVIPALLSSWGS
jgi:hypothetical protein